MTGRPVELLTREGLSPEVDHFAVDYDLVWEVATERVPELRVPIAALISG